MMAIVGDLNRGFKMAYNFKSDAQHTPLKVQFCPQETEVHYSPKDDDVANNISYREDALDMEYRAKGAEKDTGISIFGDDLGLGAPDTDMSSFFDDIVDPMGCVSRAQYISPTRLHAIRNARSALMRTRATYTRARYTRNRYKRAKYNREITARDQGIAIHDFESRHEPPSRFDTSHDLSKKYTNGSDYMDSFKDAFGDDDYVVPMSGIVATGSGYRFPNMMPKEIEQLMAFWENDFQVDEEVYPKMSSWEKLGFVGAMKKVPRDYDEYCKCEKLVKKWLACGQSKENWDMLNHGPEAVQIVYPKQRANHNPADYKKKLINFAPCPRIRNSQVILSRQLIKRY